MTTKFAAVATDGVREVVWGVGDTREVALSDANAGDNDFEMSDLDMREITDEQVAVVMAGDVAWPIVDTRTAEREYEREQLELDRAAEAKRA